MKINILVLKIASRCNLNCSYCYVYNAGDTTYLTQPKLMSTKTVDFILKRVLEHCLEYELTNFLFIFHGGEPMLQKPQFFSYFVTESHKILTQAHGISCRFGIQTNGLLITKEWCDLFTKLHIHVGISLDGLKEVNDKYRVDHKNRGSYDSTIKGLQLAQKVLKDAPGILSVIDVNSDPVETYQHFKKLGVRSFDLKWPYASLDAPPNRDSCFDGISEKTAYADWLSIVFDIWYREQSGDRPKIRIFDTIVSLILGSEMAGNEDFGVKENKVLCIQTNGDLEVVGALNLCGDGFTKSKANVQGHSFSEALQTKLARVYHESHKKLPKKCMQCPIHEVCGGGHIVTRFSQKNGFDNVSVYCQDYMKLFTHIRNAIVESLPDKYQTQYEKITYEELKTYLDTIEMDTIADPVYVEELRV